MYAKYVKIGQFFDRLAGAKSSTQVTEKAADKDETKVKNANKSRSESFPYTKFVLIVVTIGASFLFGMAVQKSHDDATTRILGALGNGSGNQSGGSSGGNSGSSSGGGFSGGSGGYGGYGGFGGASISTSQVTAISSTSITVTDSSGNSDTYAITSNTTITDSGQQVSTSDIQTGDTVIVIPDRADTSTARRIIVNPDFGNNQPSIDPGQTQIN